MHRQLPAFRRSDGAGPGAPGAAAWAPSSYWSSTVDAAIIDFQCVDAPMPGDVHHLEGVGPIFQRRGQPRSEDVPFPLIHDLQRRWLREAYG
jgi:hypothetical protein